MPVSFNSILTANGINPSEVRLIRHKDTRASRGFGPYELWRKSSIIASMGGFRSKCGSSVFSEFNCCFVSIVSSAELNDAVLKKDHSP